MTEQLTIDALLTEIDRRIDGAEGDAIEARWDFGRTLLAERVGKKLPDGRLDQIAELIGKSHREIQCRMRFAERYPDPDSLRNAITQYGSWFRIVNEAIVVPGEAHVSQNSGDNEWYTPTPYLEAARQTMGAIDLDPASSAEANALVGAATFYTEADDGLTLDWSGRVWMNPPYAAALIGPFCTKLADHYRDGAVTEACVLVNNGTETAWFQALADHAAALCFPRGRVQFWHPRKTSATPLQGQAVIYLGANVGRFLDAYAPFGIIATI